MNHLLAKQSWSALRFRNMSREKSHGVLLWLVAIGFFMQTLDTTIVNTAIPSMAKSLGESPLQMQSVVVSYALMMAILTPASGWLADRFGTRKIYLLSIFLFTLGSLFCAASHNLTQLIISRIIQGMGGAMLQPVGRLAVLKAFPHEKFLKAMSFVTVPGLVGPLLGPTLGGWLSQSFSWHWIFLINIPVGTVGFILSAIYMDDFRPPKLKHFDISGFLMIAFGMVAVSYALDGVVELGMRQATAMLLIIIGLVFIACYWLHASHKKDALFPLNLFNVITYRVGILGNFFSRIGISGSPFLLPLFFQVGLGYSPIKSGLMLLPAAISGILVKRVGVNLIHQIGYRNTLMWNTIIIGIVLVSFSFLSGSEPLWLILLQLFIMGGANSLQFTAMNTLTLKDVEDAQASSSNSLLSMVTIFTMSLGVAVAAALLALFRNVSSIQHDVHPLFAFHASFICIGVISAITAFIFAQLPKEKPKK